MRPSGRPKGALQRAANDLTGRLDDTLAAIPSPSGTNRWTADFDHPATGNRVSQANLLVPADTLIVFVGSRDLPGSLDGQADARLFDFRGPSLERPGPGTWGARGGRTGRVAD